MRVLRFISGNWVLLALSAAASFVSGIMTLGALVITFRLIRSDENRNELLLAFVACGVIVVATRAVGRSLLDRISGNAIYDMRTRLSRQVVDAPLIEIERIGVARLMTGLTDDVGKVAASLPHLTAIWAHLTFLAASFAYLGWLSPVKLLVTVLVVGTGLLLHRLLQGRGIRYLRQSRAKWDQMVQALRGLVDGLKEVTLNAARRAQALSDLAERAGEVRSSARRHSAYFGHAVSAMQVLFFVALGLANLNLEGRVEDPDVVLAYSVVIIWMMIPLQGIAMAWQGLSEGSVALGRLDQVGLKLDAVALRRHAIEREPATVAGVSSWRQLEVVALRHRYPTANGRDEFALGPIDLTLTRGELVFVVGGNGSGKTTFAKLLTGLYAPSTGEIRVDGQPVADADRDQYRQNFSAVFSDFFLFDRLPNDGSPQRDADAERLLRRLNMTGRVSIKNGRLSTTTALSLGERKRLALLHAYLEDRPIYVFDEWAADQDPIFKEAFYREMLPELKARGKLVVVISHDDRYFDVADSIVILERGMPCCLRRPDVHPGHVRTAMAVQGL
jgi:putative ATP-binding cassette transporter